MAPKQQPGVRVSEQFSAENPDADPSATELVLNVLATGQILMNRVEELLRPFGLSSGTFTLLQIVAGDPEAVTPSQIAGRANPPVTTATVTGLLDTCERKGWVQRRRHPSDRRSVLVDLTPEGAALLRRVVPAITGAEHRWTATTTAAQRRRLTTALGQLAEHLSSPAADPD
jgi:DNA-binding MarR family transcriptional regulator